MPLCTRLIAAFILTTTWLQAQNNVEMFDPPAVSQEFWAAKTELKIAIDGELNETDWNLAPLIEGLVQKDPYQGQPASQKTEIRVLYNEQFLYVGAVCYQPKSVTRVQNLRRDFDYDFNDLFGVAIDGYKDKRNASVFQASPYGNIRDLQSLDANLYNREWDALWQARTKRYDDRWVVEMAIPWKVLRYPADCQDLGIIFTRNIRSNNELTSLPGVPRLFDVYRMAYEGILRGIQPPPPTANVQLNPYLFVDGNQTKTGSVKSDPQNNVKVGGEVKWAINSSTVLDATVNTDFAQADVDRQVVNFDRYSVFFPERRQFFLESANVFNPSITDWIRPFFSRRIGLDDNGNAIPIDGGLRLTSQNAKRQYGVLAMRQRETSATPNSHFGVARYSQNLSDQSRLGGMATWRHDAALENNGNSRIANNNYTATIDGVFRPNQAFGAQGMFSASFDEAKGNGFAGQFWTGYENNQVYVGLLEYFSKDYEPGVGLEIFDANYVMTSPAISFDLRPKWLPKFIRSFQPESYAYIFNSSDNGNLLFGYWGINPFEFIFQDGTYIDFTIEPNWQRLDAPFSPVGIQIAPGFYDYIRYIFQLRSDLSAKIGGSLRAEVGDYFDGTLNTYTLSGRLAPIPHFELQVDYELNEYKNLGIENRSDETHLLGVNARLALNPRVQLIGFYQWNSSVDRSVWNVRFSWEYRPLSFIYLVFNSNQIDSLNPENRLLQQQYLGKITFLKQL